MIPEPVTRADGKQVIPWVCPMCNTTKELEVMPGRVIPAEHADKAGFAVWDSRRGGYALRGEEVQS